jgi:hypothetical protein
MKEKNLNTFEKALKILIVLFLIVTLNACGSQSNRDFYMRSVVPVAKSQYSKIGNVYLEGLTPRTLNDDNTLKSVSPYDWTSGFYSGIMWYMYALTNNDQWKEAAINYTEILDTIQYWSGNHDVGFMINCSYGNGYRYGDMSSYEEVIVNAAKSLSKRFNPFTKTFESWDYRKAWNDTTEWFFPVIIDNMMNLELLFEAYNFTGNKNFYDIAVTHANTTMENHYRPDYSSYHVVSYDEKTGKVLDKATCQGYADESSWSRGQAWGLYGFVVCYRETKDKKYLSQALGIANYIMKHPSIPKDRIPYWDYHINDPNMKVEWPYDPNKDYMYKDVSAAAITASALLELRHYVDNDLASNFKNYSEEIIKSLLSPQYLANSSEDNYFLLKHSIGSIPHKGDVDKPVNYADYYFLEALLRLD